MVMQGFCRAHSLGCVGQTSKPSSILGEGTKKLRGTNANGNIPALLSTFYK